MQLSDKEESKPEETTLKWRTHNRIVQNLSADLVIIFMLLVTIIALTLIVIYSRVRSPVIPEQLNQTASSTL